MGKKAISDYFRMFGESQYQNVDSTDVSLSEHDKRFHPDGYQHGDECKYREQLEKKDDEDAIRSDSDEKRINSMERMSDALKNWIGKDKIFVVSKEEADKVKNAFGSNIRASVDQEELNRWRQAFDSYNKDRSKSRMVSDYDLADFQEFKRVKESLRTPLKVLPRIPMIMWRSFRKAGQTTNRDTDLTIYPHELDAMIDPDDPNMNPLHDSRVESNGHHRHYAPRWALSELPVILDKPLAVFRDTKHDNRLDFIFMMSKRNSSHTGKNQSRQYVPFVVVVGNDSDSKKVSVVTGFEALPVYLQDKNAKAKEGGYCLYFDEEQNAQLPSNLQMAIPKELKDRKESERSINESNGAKEIKHRGRPRKVAQPVGGSVLLKDRARLGDLILTKEDFFFHDVGSIANSVGDVNRQFKQLRRYGDEKSLSAMKDLQNAVANKLGFDFDPFRNEFYDRQDHSRRVSAELEQFDGNGNFIELSRRFGMDRLMRTDKGEIAGWYNRDDGTVHLVSGVADAKTVAHELGWHATFHWAEQHHKGLYNSLVSYASRATQDVHDYVEAIYDKSLSSEELLDEIGAERFTRDFMADMDQETEYWWDAIDETQDAAREAFIRDNEKAATISQEEMDRIARMSPYNAVKELVRHMVAGHSLPEGDANDSIEGFTDGDDDDPILAYLTIAQDSSPYYSDIANVDRDVLTLVVSDTVKLITSIEERRRNPLAMKLKKVIYGECDGEDVEYWLMKRCGVPSFKARRIVRDQLHKVFERCQLDMWVKSGIKRVRWTHGDSSDPRDYHEVKWDGVSGLNGDIPNGLDGFEFQIDNPPVIDVKSGLRGFPSDLIGCSCYLTAIPER